MFRLGNHAIAEVLFGVAQDFEDGLLYTLDQLSSAQIEISASPTEIKDKLGNVIRNLYTSKTGSFSATSALLSPAIVNAGSGSKVARATTSTAINMPKIVIVKAGGNVTIPTGSVDSVHVIGLFSNGSNSTELTKDTTASFDTAADTGKYACTAGGSLTVPAAATDAPIQYLVKYTYAETDGLRLANTADGFADTVQLTLMCSYVDPCDDQLKPCYVYIPSFQADPSTTISLDRENQNVDFKGTLQMDYCSTEKVLYYIYYPNQNLVASGIGA